MENASNLLDPDLINLMNGSYAPQVKKPGYDQLLKMGQQSLQPQGANAPMIDMAANGVIAPQAPQAPQPQKILGLTKKNMITDILRNENSQANKNTNTTSQNETFTSKDQAVMPTFGFRKEPVYNAKGKQTGTRTVALTGPQEMLKSLDALKGNIPEVEAYSKQADDFIKQANALENNGGGFESADLSPLMAYADAMAGTKLAASYKAPDSHKAAIKALRDNATKYDIAAKGLPLQYLKSATGMTTVGSGKSLTSGSVDAASVDNVSKNTNSQENVDGTSSTDTTKTGVPAKVTMNPFERTDDAWLRKDIAPGITSLNTMLDITQKPGNPAETGRLMFAMAKSAQGVGVLSDADLRIGAAGDTTLMAGLDRLIAKKVTGEGLNDGDYIVYRQAATRAAMRRMEEIQNQIEEFAKRRSDVTGEDINSLVQSYFKRAGMTKEAWDTKKGTLPKEEKKSTDMYNKMYPDAQKKSQMFDDPKKARTPEQQAELDKLLLLKQGMSASKPVKLPARTPEQEAELQKLLMLKEARK